MDYVINFPHLRMVLWLLLYGLSFVPPISGITLSARHATLSASKHVLRDILRTTTRPRCSIFFVTDGSSSSATLNEVLQENDFLHGIQTFEVKIEHQGQNKTRMQLSMIVTQALELRRSYQCVILVVSSNDYNFLDLMCEVHRSDVLMLWKQRPIFVTGLDMGRLRGIIERHWNLFTTNAMVIHVQNATLQNTESWIGIYSHTPSSPADGGHLIRLATWTPYRGLSSYSFFEKHPRRNTDLHRNAISIKEALKDPVALKDLLENPGSFRFGVPVSAMIAVEHWFPHVIIRRSLFEEGQIDLSGSMANLLDALATSLNFTYKLIRPKDGEWGSKKDDGSWSGMVGQVYRHECDIALGPHDLTEIRATAIDYTTPIFNDARKFVVGQSRAEVDPWGFLLPLTPVVWIGLLLTLLVVTVTTAFVGENYRRDSPPTYLSEVTLHTFRLLLLQGLTMKLEKVSERTVVCGWIIGGMIVCWSYSTNLMSLLAVRYAPRPIQSIQDLLNNDKMTVIFTPNTALTDYIENVDSGQLRDLANLRLVGRYRDVHFTEFPKALGTLVRRGDHVIATDTTDGTRLIANYFSEVGSCNFYMSRDPFVPFVMGMIGQKGSPLVEAITHRIGAIVAGGLYRQWLGSNFANSTSCRHMPSRFTVKEPLSLANIWGMFVLLACGLMTAGVIFLLEITVTLSWTSKDKGKFH